MTQQQTPGPPQTPEELLAALAEFAGYLRDGVIGMYEPSYAMASLLRLLTLTEQRITALERDNARLWAAFTKHEGVS